MSVTVDRVNVSIPSTLRKQAQELASERGLSLSNLLSILLAEEFGLRQGVVRRGRPLKECLDNLAR